MDFAWQKKLKAGDCCYSNFFFFYQYRQLRRSSFLFKLPKIFKPISYWTQLLFLSFFSFFFQYPSTFYFLFFFSSLRKETGSSPISRSKKKEKKTFRTTKCFYKCCQHLKTQSLYQISPTSLAMRSREKRACY